MKKIISTAARTEPHSKSVRRLVRQLLGRVGRFIRADNYGEAEQIMKKIQDIDDSLEMMAREMLRQREMLESMAVKNPAGG